MKNNIIYYYNINISKIIKKDNYYQIYDNNQIYLLKECNFDYEKIYNVYNLSFILNNLNYYVDIIMLNKNNTFITSINNKNYILLKKIINDEGILSINYLYEISKINIKNEIKNFSIFWKDLWKQKIDYYEYEIEELKNKYPYISFYIYYYIGLAETGINLLSIYNFNVDPHLSHCRINYKMKKNDLYDPLNIIIDTKARNYAEFYKSEYYSSNMLDIIKYTKNLKLSNQEYLLLFIRLLYITPFFDLVDLQIKYRDQDYNKKLEVINSITPSYIFEIHKLYMFLKTNNIICEIEWL